MSNSNISDYLLYKKKITPNST